MKLNLKQYQNRITSFYFDKKIKNLKNFKKTLDKVKTFIV